MKKLNCETAADKLYEVAIKRFTDSHYLWLGDVQMMKTQSNDYLDLIKIANLVNGNDISRAAKAMFALDTEVRDYIPSNVFNWIADNR